MGVWGLAPISRGGRVDVPARVDKPVAGRGSVPRPSSFPRGTVAILPFSLGLGGAVWLLSVVVRAWRGVQTPPPIKVTTYGNQVTPYGNLRISRGVSI